MRRFDKLQDAFSSIHMWNNHREAAMRFVRDRYPEARFHFRRVGSVTVILIYATTKGSRAKISRLLIHAAAYVSVDGEVEKDLLTFPVPAKYDPDAIDVAFVMGS